MSLAISVVPQNTPWWRNKISNPKGRQTRSVYSFSGAKIQKGVILLADISGFTNFVRKIDPEIGVHVIRDLLSSIIHQNRLGLKVNEIEGDAILFYKVGKPPALKKVFRQFELMSAKFYEQLDNFSSVPEDRPQLALKVIIHYGSFSIYKINGFTKLYGTSIIEAHRLLKNSIDSDRYLLITENYLKSLGDRFDYNHYGSQNCEMYNDIGKICYHYLHA